LRVLYSYSPVITPKPKEWWIEGIQITGYWFLNDKNSNDIPREISDFLKDGDPPIFISAMWNIHLFTKAALFQMQELLGRRLIVQDLLENSGMKQRTVALGKKINSENGARNAAEFILEELNMNSSPSVHSRLLL
jgi:hypothetical protein